MEQSEQTEVVATPMVKTPIALDQAGVIQPSNLDEAWRAAQMYIASKMLPARFDSAAMVVTAMQFAKELRLPGLVSLRQIAVVQGTPCLFGDLPLALVQRDGNLEWIKEFLLDEKGNQISVENKNASAQAVAAVCQAKRKGDKEPIERVFSMDDARKAGLDGGPTWKKYPKLMLKYRARSQALKDKFPDSLNGVAIAEYDHHVLPSEESPKLADAAGELNAAFVGEEAAEGVYET